MSLPALLAPYLIAGEGLVVENPATGRAIATVRAYAPDEIADIIAAADAARPAWAALTAAQRAAVLHRWHGLILAHTEDLAAIITAESGKPIGEARGEVGYGASFINWFAEEARRDYGETIPTFAPGKRPITIRQPIGTCAAITPWNFPLAMITRKAAPALAAGCAMVVKPAEATPLTALAMEALAIEAGLPEGLLRVVPVTDPAAAGLVLSQHPLIRKLSFTGSTRVGKILMAQAAENVVKVSLELGGNAPFIVFDDADLDAAVEGALAAKYRNAGQTCVCANRILAQDGVHDAFAQKLAARVAAMRVGDGAQGNDIGPLIDAGAVAKVAALVEDAVAQGAQAITGGARGDQGAAFYQPTVLAGVTQAMAIANTEIFGPVAPIIRFATEAEAIAIANDTPYGLAAYFYARDVGRVVRVMEALEYGMVGVNEGLISTEVAPFGGVKQSGIGREGSRHGLAEYTQVKYCLIGGIGQG
ncbi:MAG TPA: NAD-dependent succinate-semialdehyde dehydrogenase [Novosphingobium sp.]|nr:NAD-dependent succinate-semialdehyde dehydrogenase [Novosphingobium sp.]